MRWNVNRYSTMEYLIDHVFAVFKRLTHLIFSQSSYQTMFELTFPYPSINFSSNTLLVLNTKVRNFDVCLSILDGRFNQLHTFIVELENIFSTSRIRNEVSFFLRREQIEYSCIFFRL